jgi:hypothetical protein
LAIQPTEISMPKAMPQAAPQPETEEAEFDSSSSTLSQRASRLADKARAHPKKAVAAGAAFLVGALAAAAIPLVRTWKKPASSARGRSRKATA